jgi:GAF domain-containing protein
VVEKTGGIEKLRVALEEPGTRADRLRRAAAVIREAGPYRWVGIYDVLAGEIAIAAWSGPAAPAFPRFSIDRGLCGDAVRRGETVIVGDVTKDPRYLTTFGSTRSEIVVPILDSVSGHACGTLDVESERADAFGPDDRAFLEHCAAEIATAESPSPG